jgi:hypothetical protein
MPDRQGWIVVFNADAQPVPPYGLMAVTGMDSTGAYKVKRPQSDGQQGLLVNGAIAIPPNAYGQAHQNFPAIVGYQNRPGDDTAPQLGQVWGVQANQWTLQANQPGYYILGGAANGLVNVIPWDGEAWIQVTSTTTSTVTLTSGSTISCYPAQVAVQNMQTGAWSLVAGGVWWEGANSEVPTLNNRYQCQLQGADINGKPIWATTVSSGGGGGGSSIALQDKTGATVDATCQFLEADAGGVLTFTNTSAHHDQIALSDASTTQRGVVNLTTQSFIGQKNFTTSAVVGGTAIVGGDAFDVYGTSTFTQSGAATAVVVTGTAGNSNAGITCDGWISFGYVGGAPTTTTGSVAMQTGISLAGSAPDASYAVFATNAGGGIAFFACGTTGLEFGMTNGTVPNLYITTGVSTSAQGQTGTDAIGNKFTSGLCTTIGSGGSVRAFGASATITTATDTALALNSSRFDTNSYHSNVTNNSRLTVPAGLAGVYQISGTVEWAGVPAGTNVTLFFRLNGSTIIAQDGPPTAPTGGGGSVKQAISTLYKLAVSDYVELCVRQNSGGSLTINSSGNYSPEFGMVRVGN